MRLFQFLLMTVAAGVLSASTAHAGVEFSLPGGNSATLAVGETIRIEIDIANVGATAALRQSVSGMGASIFGYDEGVADFVPGTGRAASQFFGVCGTEPEDPTGCYGGLEQCDGCFFSEMNLVETTVGSAKRIQIVAAASTTPTNRSGSGDFGYDRTFSTPAFVVTFQATGVGQTVLRIGTGFPGDALILSTGAEFQVPEIAYTIHVVPEPGTVLLVGLGLAGLASAGRRG